MHQNTPIQFIYTPFLAISHITIIREEPDVTMFGLYGNMLLNEMPQLVLQCNFTQMNDLLHLADCVAEETIEYLADVLGSGITEPQTIDVTDKGGINFNDLLFCLAVIPTAGDEEEDVSVSEKQECYLHAFIKKDSSVRHLEGLLLPSDKQSRLNYYLSILSIQYDFYLHYLKQKIKTGEALFYAGLQDELIFMLAKTGYEMRQIVPVAPRPKGS